jgi:signal transduction histidine kinase/CheY-like chemotaxis protein
MYDKVLSDLKGERSLLKRATTLMALQSSRLYIGALNVKNYLQSLSKIRNITEVLHKQGLIVCLYTPIGREVVLSLTSPQNLFNLLSKTGFLSQSSEIEQYLTKLVHYYEKSGMHIPDGKLDLLRAMKQYLDARAPLEGEKRTQLEEAHVIQSVADNLEMESHRILAKRYIAIINLMDMASADNLKEACQAIVETAQELFPGGNPTIMISADREGRNVLMPVAVALNKSIVRAGEKALSIELGDYSIPIEMDSWNPYPHAFLGGTLKIERNISREQHRLVCGGFIAQRLEGMTESLFWGISYPGKKNTLIMAPLIDGKNPVTGGRRALGIMAILKKGGLTREEEVFIRAFVSTAVRIIAQIQYGKKWKTAAEESQRLQEMAQTHARVAEERARDAQEVAFQLDQQKKQLEVMQDSLLEQSRLAGIGEMAAMVSHNLKNQVSGGEILIELLSNMVRNSAALLDIAVRKLDAGLSIGREIAEIQRADQEFAKVVSNLSTGNKETRETLRGLLSFARRGNRTREDVSVKRCLKRTIATLQERAEREGVQFITFERVQKSDGLRIPPSDLRDLINNLVVNAFQSHEGNEISERIASLAITLNKEGKIVITVQDNGCGISKANMESVFSWARSGREEGHGIGMPTIKGIVEKNDGIFIRIASKTAEESMGTSFEIRFNGSQTEEGNLIEVAEQSRGTKIEISFPRIEAKAKKSISSTELQPVISRSRAAKIQVALIEDIELNRELYHKVLSDMGFEVVVFETAEDAYARISAGKIDPKIVVSDQSLPGKNGHELLSDIARFYEQKKAEVPRLLIHSGDIPPQTGEVAEVVNRLKVGWIDKGDGANVLRGTVSKVALGGKAEDRVGLVADLFGNIYFDFIGEIIHRMKNRMNVFEYFNAFGLEEGLSYVKEDFIPLVHDLRMMQEFVGQVGNKNFGEIKLISNGGLQESIFYDNRIVKLWNDRAKPEQRIGLALIASIYIDRVLGKIEELYRLIDGPVISRERAEEVEKLVNEVLDLGKAFTLQTEEGREIVPYYENLADG